MAWAFRAWSKGLDSSQVPVTFMDATLMHHALPLAWHLQVHMGIMLSMLLRPLYSWSQG
jgi:hypothetical protein